MKKRPTWDEYFKEITYTTAKRSSCEKLNVGCLFIKDNRIIAQGYNGYIIGCQHKSIIKDGHNIATIHAEQNTITDCAKRGVSCNNCEAYVTHYPCLNCAKILLCGGIKKIYYINDYKNDDLVSDFCSQMSCEICKI